MAKSLGSCFFDSLCSCQTPWCHICTGIHNTHTHTHTHLFNGRCPGLPGWASTRKVKPIWILLKQEMEWQWHQLGHMQVCTSLQADNHARTTLLFLPPSQQCQNIEGSGIHNISQNNSDQRTTTRYASARKISCPFCRQTILTCSLILYAFLDANKS